MTVRYGLNSVIKSGKHRGKTPHSLIKGSVEDVEHLLHWREQKLSFGYPIVLFDLDVHHSLDQILRMNPGKFDGFKAKFTVTEFDLFVAEKRIKRKKQQDEAIAKDEIERVKLEIERVKREENIRLTVERQKAKLEALLLADKQRSVAYLNTWGEWT